MMYNTTVPTEWPKIPTLFLKDEKRHALPEINPLCEWVLDSSEGLMSIKMDGICARVELIDGKWTVSKRMSEKNFMRINPDDFIDKHLWEAFNNQDCKSNGIFEAYGKDIKGNPYDMDKNLMIKISPVDFSIVVPRGSTTIKRGFGCTVKELFESVRDELGMSPDIEGLVWHLESPTGMVLQKAAKIKRVDFGFPWPVKAVVN